ncbi:hypothetical protein GCM10027160_23010 [Streptomyces calidiresistens]
MNGAKTTKSRFGGVTLRPRYRAGGAKRRTGGPDGTREGGSTGARKGETGTRRGRITGADTTGTRGCRPAGRSRGSGRPCRFRGEQPGRGARTTRGIRGERIPRLAPGQTPVSAEGMTPLRECDPYHSNRPEGSPIRPIGTVSPNGLPGGPARRSMEG